MYADQCRYCGALLDPCEACDCPDAKAARQPAQTAITANSVPVGELDAEIRHYENINRIENHKECLALCY